MNGQVVRGISVALLLGPTCLCGFARVARADEAGALFDRGLAGMQAHKYDTACPALAESYRLDPHAGGLFTLAECENQWGKTASAMADYSTFLDLVVHLPPRDRARQEERAKIAAERRAGLAREVPTVTLSLDAGVPAGSTVKIDGRAVASRSLGSTLPQDPGEHVIVLQAPDGRSAEQRVSLAKHDARAITLVLAAMPSAFPEPPPPPPPVVAPDSGSDRRTAVFITAGVGAAGLVAGTILGAIVLSDKSSIDQNCPTPTTCASPSDASSANGARTLGWASTGAFIGGGAAIGAAVVLWLTRPKTPPAVEPVVAPTAGGASIGLRAAF